MAEEKKEEKKTYEEKEEAKGEIKVPKKFKDLVEKIEKLNVLELSELVKVLEKKFGVSAAAPVAVGAVAQTGTGDASGAADEKSEFDVELKSAGDSKIAVIKLVKEITGKGLKESKDLVDGVPKVIKEKAAKDEAEEMKKKFEEVGATIELK